MNRRGLKITVPILALVGLYFMMSAMGLGNDILDMRIYYTSEDAAKYLLNLSLEKANLYFDHELFDLLFLTSYSALFFFSFEGLFPHASSLKWITVLPGLFDLFETTGILVALSFGPKSLTMCWLGIFTLLKWLSGLVVVLVLLSRTVYRGISTAWAKI